MRELTSRARPEERWQDEVIRYFEVAGPDYAAWSKQFNMHFGFWERGLNPLRREALLEHMNQVTLDRLFVPSEVRMSLAGAPVALADMGCGLGATARYIARRLPLAQVTGFTIVPWQVASGNRMSHEQGLSSQVALVLSDFTTTPCEPATMDGAWAIESSCYATGPDKADLVAEMARIVKPGGRVVFSDGFRKDTRPFGPLLRAIYRTACRSWAIREMAEIDSFTRALHVSGFRDVRAEEVSWHVAPSFAHIPFLCVKFTLQRFVRGEFAWPKERWQNLMGPLFGSLLGLCRHRFGYYLVSAVRSS